MDVILKAKKELVIVSPYVNLTYSKQVSAALIAARNRGVNIEFYIRDEANNSLSKEQVEVMGIAPRLVPNLHAKLYFNETTGIIASLNLLSSSISNSIEIGGQLETAEELEELRLFVAQFITPHEIGAAAPVRPPSAPVAPTTKVQQLTWEEKKIQQQEFGQTLADYLEAKVDPNSYVEGDQALMKIRAVGNNFTVTLEADPALRKDFFASNQLILHGVLSGSEADRFATKSSKHYTSSAYNYMIQRGGRGYYDQVCATRKAGLLATTFNRLTLAEKRLVLSEIGEFLLATQAFKADYRN